MLRTRVRAGAAAGLFLSLGFAALFTIIGAGEVFISSLTPSIGEPTPMTLRVPYGPRIVRDRRDGRSHLLYEHTRIIVPRGTVLSDLNDEHRAAFAYDSIRRPPRPARLASQFVIYFIICLMLTAYLRLFGQSRVRLLRAQFGLLVLLLASLLVEKTLLLFTGLPEFWIPMASLPLWIAMVFDRRTSFLVNIGVAFIAASLLRFDLILLSVVLVRSIAATLFFFNRKHARQMLIAGTLAGLAGAVAFVALTVIFEGRFDLIADLKRGLSSNVLSCIGGGIVAGLLARGLREPAERVMGHVSRDKLLDLTDLEQPLLKKMSAEAPGSWEHARSMANLAESASAAIGADALLTRVGAYYHDLGKTIQPKYFVENLTPGERSPHEDLEPDVSADAIMAHVVLGAKLLREGRIPEPVVEFAYTHHGTQLVEFFWHKCLEQGNPKGLTAEHFRYPGMKPQTKETAILMLVDSIEAASRTIWPPDHKKFEEMIQRIIFTKLSAGQLDESGLTLEDLRIMTSRMASTLVNMYHGRIKYPWQKEAERAAAAKEAAATATATVTATPVTPVTPVTPAEQAAAVAPAGAKEAAAAPPGPSDPLSPPVKDEGEGPLDVEGRDTLPSRPPISAQVLRENGEPGARDSRDDKDK
jgi:putative nucleotidyltransferase with HDIG domain